MNTEKIQHPHMLNNVFKETDLEVIDPVDVSASVRHAITAIPDKITDLPVKVRLHVHIRYLTINNEMMDVWVSTKMRAIHSFHDLNENWAEEMLTSFNAASEEAKLRGSGWSEGKVLELKLKQTKYSPIAGHSFIPLPKEVADKKAVLNIKNNDNKCFAWCVLARLHNVKQNAERVSKYQCYLNELNFDGIDFPVSIHQISRFESQNNVSVNVYGWSEERKLFPIHVSDNSPTFGEPDKRHVDLLLVEDGPRSHYTLIRTMSRLVKYTSNNNGKQEFCRRCLFRIPTIHAAAEHIKHCNSPTDCVTQLICPQPDSKAYFKNFQKMQSSPYVVYCDFESLIVDYLGPMPENLPKTVKINNHQICSFAYVVVRSDGAYYDPQMYRGPDAASYFLTQMQHLRNQLSNQLNLSEIVMTPEDQQQFELAQTCWICKNQFALEDQKVRDHDHISGKFRGAAHNDCNLKLKVEPNKWKMPIFFHNLRGYDSHLILQAVTSEFSAKCIAQSSEKYMTFTLNNLSFYDSAQHMMGTLESLAESLTRCPITEKYFDRQLVRKGVFCYEYMNSWERFDEETLPPKGAFFSKLKGTDISDSDYEHAKFAWEKLGCKTMGDYHDAYLMADVCLLADVFENYRKTCMKHYSLDPSHYISAPGMSWDAFLRSTGVEIDLLSDLPTIQMIEDGLRGGISMASHGYCKANNKYLEDFDPNQKSNYLMYLDANNLYGWAMCQTLPLHQFKMYVGPFDISKVLNDLITIGPDAEVGFILEVDLKYPDELHDLHNDYPLAAERKIVGNELPKLVPNLLHKTKYVCHYRLLQFYLRHGLQLTAVHRIIEFQQTQFMKPYIMKNTELRTKATDASEKNYFKLMNNSCFGKTMENPHKRKDVRLVTRENAAIKLVSKPQYTDFKKFHDCLYGIMMKKTKVKLDKPVFIGFTVLELSKLLMLEFLYDYFKPRYPESRVLYTDTDSFILDIPTEDFYKDLEEDVAKGETSWYDTSDYPKESPLHSSVNKKVIGKMKDEINGTVIKEYVGLRSKMYSVASQTSVMKKAKGISTSVVKKNITHDNYKEALFESKVFYHDNVKLRSELHEINTTVVTKKSLDSTNTKRVYVNPELSYAIGHWRTRQQQQ